MVMRQLCARSGCGIEWSSPRINNHCCGFCRRDEGHSSACSERRHLHSTMRQDPPSSSSSSDGSQSYESIGNHARDCRARIRPGNTTHGSKPVRQLCTRKGCGIEWSSHRINKHCCGDCRQNDGHSQPAGEEDFCKARRARSLPRQVQAAKNLSPMSRSVANLGPAGQENVPATRYMATLPPQVQTAKLNPVRRPLRLRQMRRFGRRFKDCR